MLNLSFLVGLAALAYLGTASVVRNWKIVLEEKLDGCPCKVKLGGTAVMSPGIASEIIPRSEYNAWIASGRPYRFAKLSDASPAVFDKFLDPRSLGQFCFNTEKNVPGDYNIILYSSGNDVRMSEVKEITRPECPAGATFEDYGKFGDRNECDNEESNGSNGERVSGDSYSAMSTSLTPAARIFRGDLVLEKNVAAYNVKIVHLDEHQHINVEFCSGSLIAPQYVLTAAHCPVKVGEHVLIGDFIGGKGEDHKVVEAIPHPDYAELRPAHDNRVGAEINDIQLLRLEAPVTNAESRMVAVNTDCWRPVPCREALVSGYGESVEGKCNDEVLRSARVNIIGHDACHQLLRDANEGLVEHCLDESPHICASHSLCGSGLCHGDSGGPLVVVDRNNADVVQVGISSYIIGDCGARDHPDVYTRVSAYKTWINEHTNGTAKFNPPLSTDAKDCPRIQVAQHCNETDGIVLTGSGGDPVDKSQSPCKSDDEFCR